MELQKLETHVVEKSQDFPEKEFTIRANAQSFKILSSGLYSDKIAAIVRELCTNAYDSHVLAGNEEKPFDIYFPNRLAPFFKVRDYGTSIAHEDMPDVYCTFFGSTKTSSNLQQGAFGLGSKAFLSYVTSASVTTFIDGVKRMYVVLLNEAGLPTINYLGESETDEENGLEVQLPVDHKDFHSFTSKISLLRYFPVKPNVHGIARFEWPENKYDPSIEGSFWKLFAQYEAASHNAVMGYIAYPISINQLDTEAAEFLEFLARDCSYLEIQFPIGAFEITPSREHISYDLRTVRVLSEQVLKIKKEFVAKLELEININSKTYFEACKFYNTLKSKSSRILAQSVKYQGRTLTDRFDTSKFEEDFFEYDSEILNNGKVRVCRDGDHITNVYVNDIINKPLFYADIPNAAYVLRSWIRLETEKSGIAKTVQLVQDAPDQKHHSKFLDVFGFDGSEIRFVSELVPIVEAIPKAPKKPRSSSVKPEAVKKIRAILTNKSTECLSDIVLDFDAGGLWTPINGYDADEFSITLAASLFADSVALRGTSPEVYGVRKVAQDKFQKHPKWIKFNYAAYLDEFKTFLLTDKDLHNGYILQSLTGDYRTNILDNSSEFCLFVLKNTDNEFKKNNPDILNAKINPNFNSSSYIRSYTEVKDLRSSLNVEIEKKKKEIQDALHDLASKYPLLQYFDHIQNGTEFFKNLKDYLNNPQIHEAP